MTSAIGLAKRYFMSPVIFGLAAGIMVVLFNLLITASLGDSMHGGYLDIAGNNKLVYLIPLAVALQMGLFRHYWNISRNKPAYMTEIAGVSGSAFSTVTLVACCVACCTPPMWSVLPAIGVITAASSFAMQYQDAILMIAFLANIIGSIVLLLIIRRHKRDQVKMI